MPATPCRGSSGRVRSRLRIVIDRSIGSIPIVGFFFSVPCIPSRCTTSGEKELRAPGSRDVDNVNLLQHRNPLWRLLRIVPAFFLLLLSPATAQVRVWQGTLTLPTYGEGAPDANPPFDQYANGRFNYPYTLRDELDQQPKRLRLASYLSGE